MPLVGHSMILLLALAAGSTAEPSGSERIAETIGESLR
mgnify:CR=1 FL=1